MIKKLFFTSYINSVKSKIDESNLIYGAPDMLYACRYPTSGVVLAAFSLL
jgi:hypothetical protein